jgi:hypothetical protein
MRSTGLRVRVFASMLGAVACLWPAAAYGQGQTASRLNND